MLLNNYKAILCSNSQGIQTYTTLSGNSESYGGYDYQYQISVGAAYNYTISGGRGSVALDVGFDDTPETAGDYAWNGNLVSAQLSHVAGGVIRKALGEIMSVYSIFKNNTGSNVTVREIGITGNASSSTSGANQGLWIRKVLDTPIVIAPGETYSFTYVLRLKNT